PITTTTTTIYRPPPVEPPAAFAPAATYPVGEYNPWQVAVADFNRDGNQDMAVAEPLGEHPEDNVAGDVAVLMGTGDGTFGPASHLPYESPGTPPAPISPRSVAVGDFNEDGIADLAAANAGGAGTYSVSLFAGIGDGTFAAATHFATGTVGRPHMLVVDDLNGDGFDDVVLASFQPPPNGGDMAILLGTGTGSLGPATRYPTGFGTTSIATGDFNEDGRRDVVVTNLLAGDLSLRLGTGGGSLGPATRFRGVKLNPNIVAVAELTGDGHQDLAVTMLDGGVEVHPGTGTGTFGAAKEFAVGLRPSGVTAGDFNGDGRTDLAVANGGNQADTQNPETVSVLAGTGSGNFGAPLNLIVGGQPFAVAAGDFNGDAWADLAVGNNGTSDVSVLLNTAAPAPPPRPVRAASGSAFGFHINVSFFGGPPQSQG
ncbi:MAG: VCBS repeat-containing protein, partial [Actinobacteria bacterium]|nr:VCBS repeat-containing protein [Actinomycetota bacterium]